MRTPDPARPHFTSPIDWIDSNTSELADQVLLYEVRHPEGPSLSRRAVEGLGADLGVPTITGKFGDPVGSLQALGEALLAELQLTLQDLDVEKVDVEEVIKRLCDGLLSELKRGGQDRRRRLPSGSF